MRDRRGCTPAAIQSSRQQGGGVRPGAVEQRGRALRRRFVIPDANALEIQALYGLCGDF